MSAGQDILRSLVIIVFASGIVAIGAQELYQKHGTRSNRSLKEREMNLLEQLRGSDLKAQMSPERVDRAVERRGAEARDSERRSENQKNDNLSHQDRLELDRLLNTLTP